MNLIDRYVRDIGRRLPQKSHADIEKEIRSALAEDPAAAQRRRDFARAHTWQRRYEELAPAIGAAFPHPGAPPDPSSGSP